MEGIRKMSRDAAVVILAAGKGTRMNSDLPKVLHPIGNAPMLHHAMRAARSLGPKRTASESSAGPSTRSSSASVCPSATLT